MYEGHFNLTSDPFRLLPDPGICFPHRSCARAWSYLRYGVKRGEGIVVVIGPPGSGKTTLADRLLSELNPSKTVSVRLIAHDLSPTDLLRKLAYAFGLPAEGIDQALLAHRIERYLFGLEQTNRRALVVIDEAQALSNPALEAMRLLTDLQSRSHPVLQLILMGQPELETAMSAPEMEQFQHRVIASCRLLPMGLTETKAYLEYRLDRSGWQGDPTFDGPAVMAIYRHSGGLPRHVNKIGSRLLLHAASEDNHCLAESDVQAVVSDLRGELIAPENLGGPVDPLPGQFDDSIYELALVPNTRPSTSGRRAVHSLAGLYPKTEAGKPAPRVPRAAPTLRPRVAEGSSTVATAMQQALPSQRGVSSANTWPNNWKGAEQPRLRALPGRLWGALPAGLLGPLEWLCARVADRRGLKPGGWPVAALGGLVAVGLVVAVWQSGAGDDPEDALQMNAEMPPDRSEFGANEGLATPSDHALAGQAKPKGLGFETALRSDSAWQLIAGEIPEPLVVASDIVSGDISEQFTGVAKATYQSLVGQVGDDVVRSLVSGAREKSGGLGPEHILPTTEDGEVTVNTQPTLLAAVETSGGDVLDGIAADQVRRLPPLSDPMVIGELVSAQELPVDGSPSAPESTAVESSTALADAPAMPPGRAADAMDRRLGAALVAADLQAEGLTIATREDAGREDRGAANPGAAGSGIATSPVQESTSGAADPSQRDALVMAEVERLAVLADKAIARYRLLLPKKDSAYTYYKRIQALDPENEQAKAGLALIVAKYREISSKALDEGEFDKAKLYVARALRVDPSDTEALALRRAIDDAVEDAEVARRNAIELAAIEAEALRRSQMRQQALPQPKNELSNFERLMLSIEGRAP